MIDRVNGSDDNNRNILKLVGFSMTNQEIQEKYRGFAPWFDYVAGIPLALLGVNHLRRKLIRKASGRVLEVAAGTGLNLRYYSDAVPLVLVDISEAMLAKARRRVKRRSGWTTIVQADAAQLPFGTAVFDTVVSTLSTCTFIDPVVALREFGRVCRPEGRILLLEHGVSRYNWFAQFQHRTENSHAHMLGCHWNRRHDELVAQAGLSVLDVKRSHGGVLYMIEAAL